MVKDFSLIVAMNKDSLIGIKEYGQYTIPWPMLKQDMAFFKKMTTTTIREDQQNLIIIGYNTWKTLPISYKTNPKRKNIIISRSSLTDVPIYNEIYVPDISSALLMADDTIDNIYVIGGAVIYHEAMKLKECRKIYLTYVYDSYPPTNTVEYRIHFPLLLETLYELADRNIIKCTFESSFQRDAGRSLQYQFFTFEMEDDFSEEYCNMRSIERIQNNFPVAPVTPEIQYIDLVKKILWEGQLKGSRNAITKSIFGYQLRYDLREGFPICTVKRSYPKSIFEELMWMIRGQTDANILNDMGVKIWNANSSKEYLGKLGLPYQEGDIGPGYGFQMRHYGANYIDCKTDYTGQGIDQLMECDTLLKNDPNSRRIIINLWNPEAISKMALPPCHMIYNFNVELYNTSRENGMRGLLNCHLFQRSWDVILGWNTTTAALLTTLLAHHNNYDPGAIVHSITDAHIYKTHFEAAEELIKRSPRVMPTARFIRKHDNIEDYKYEDFVLDNYYPCPPITAKMVA